jgi:PKD repeat protein
VRDSRGRIDRKIASITIQNRPVALFTCTQEGALKLNCDASASYDPENKALSYRFEFADESIEDTKIASREFATFGSKIVKLIVTNSDGKEGMNQQSFVFNKVHQSPVASFEEEVDLGFKVIFDATASLYQERTITNYEWNFNGTIQSTTNQKIEFTFSGLGNVNVSLTVTDELGEKSTISKTILVYDPEVPAPGENGKDSLFGIDSDNDGVRDEIQRWIALESSDNSAIKPVLKKIVKSWSDSFLVLNDSAQVIALSKLREKAQYCLQSKWVNFPDKSKEEIAIMGMLMFNNEARAMAYAQMEVMLAGQDSLSISQEQDLSIFCQE